MIIHPVRVSYVSVFTPAPKPNSQDKQYTLVAMVPKDNAELTRIIFEGQAKAVEAGIAKGKFSVAQTKAPTFKTIIRDGDVEFEAETRGPEFKGMWFFSCNRQEKNGAPPVVNRQGLTPIIDPQEFYSGCYAALDINFYPYRTDQGTRGIAAGLNQCMKWDDGDRLDGRLTVDQAFGELATPQDASDPDAEFIDDDKPF